jgi:hypothetical protein
MIRDAREDMRQISFGIETIQFRRIQQTVHGGGTFTARIGSGKQ